MPEISAQVGQQDVPCWHGDEMLCGQDLSGLQVIAQV